MLTLTVLALILFSASLFAQAKKESKPTKGYNGSTYSSAEAGKYMTKWLLAGPVLINGGAASPDEKSQQDFFRQNVVVPAIVTGKPVAPLVIDGKLYEWQSFKSTTDVIDLDQHYNQKDFAAAFAVAELKADKETKTFLAVGSDDGIRIWLNGKLIHDNWVPRGLTKDEDIIPITLTAGSNQIFIKVQDMQGGWSFASRLLDADGISDKLITASGRGDLDMVKVLLDANASLEKTNAAGLTALNNARLSGYDDIAKLLIEKGAKDTPFPSLATLIDGMYKTPKDKKSAGAAVLVSQNGKILYSKGFGYADIDGAVPVRTTTKFRIGSVTKQFTAAAILKLAEEGKISMDDKLSKFYPDFPRGDEITIHHLLTHVSGIHSYTSNADFISRVTSPVSSDELIESIKKGGFDFNPGERWLYNNSAYFILGDIVAKVSGKSYEAFLIERFFSPLGMTRTGVYNNKNKPTDEAKGYTKENDAYKATTDWDMSWAGGAGILYSTVEDLYKWNEALYGGKVLSEKSMSLAFTPVKLNNGEKPANASYGYGFALNDFRNKRVIEHGGGLHGFLSQLARYSDDNITVVILTNLTPPELPLNSNSIAEILLYEKLEKQKSKSAVTASEDVTQYAGRYDFSQAVMTITADGNNLFAQLGTQPKFPIYPSGNGEFFWKVVNAKIQFIKGPNGEVEYGNFEQNGNKIKVLRLKDQPVVTIDKRFLQAYAGRYQLNPNFIITITSENDKLYAQATNQPRFEILPLSEKEFTVKEVNAKLIFVTEADGKVSKFILDQGGMRQDLVRLTD